MGPAEVDDQGNRWDQDASPVGKGLCPPLQDRVGPGQEGEDQGRKGRLWGGALHASVLKMKARWLRVLLLTPNSPFAPLPVVNSTCSDFNHGSALHIAASNLCLGAAKCLLEHGANPALRVLHPWPGPHYPPAPSFLHSVLANSL